jgi:YebC/PmpR family DNA-binding regulatory protein
MSGHSKWATIKHKKGALDAKRGKVFSKLSKELMVAAKQGGSDPTMNPTLRTAIQKAKSVNMPSDNITRAVKKGAGELEGSTFEEFNFEGYASGGVALVVAILTDNRNRTTAEIRHMFTRHGSSFAAQGAVTRSFVRKGLILVDGKAVEEDKLMSIVLDAGAEDMTNTGDAYEVLTDPAAFVAVTEALEKAGIKTISAEVSLIPLAPVPVNDKHLASSILKFVSDLEEHDDVQNVYTNMDMSDEVMKEMEAEAV